MTDHDRYLFDLQGYLTIPNALDADQLSAMNALLDAHIAAEMTPDDSTHRFGGMLRWGQPFLDVIDNPRVEALPTRRAGGRLPPGPHLPGRHP